MRKADIVLSQETKHQTESFFKKFPGWKAFKNQAVKDENIGGDRDTRWKAGTVIWVRLSFLKNFEIQNEVVVEEGYVHYITLRPKQRVDLRSPVFTKPFTVINMYLYSGNSEAAKKIRLLKRMEDMKLPTKYIYAGGDTNVKDTAEDVYSGQPTTASVREAFHSFRRKHKLEELYQPLPTRLDGRSWSRIDRLFMASPAIVDVGDFMDMTVSLPSHPHAAGRGVPHPSDHLQVLLTPSPATLSPKSRFVIPTWMAKSPTFVARVKARWATVAKRKTDAFERLKLFDDVLVSVAKGMMKEGSRRTADNVAAVAVGMRVLRGVMSHTMTLDEAWKVCDEVPDIRSRLRGKRRGELQTVLAGYVRAKTGQERKKKDKTPLVWAKRTSTFSEEVSEAIPAQPAARGDFVRDTRKALEPSVSHLPYLVDEQGEYVTDTEQMANMLKEVWEPIWRLHDGPDDIVASYLASYSKRIRLEMRPVGLDDVIVEIGTPKTTCAGPNGIPFVAYAALCALAAPLFLDVIVEMGKGRSPTAGYAGFNMAELYFLPKDDTMRADQTRPIAASNTCNRIIANVVRARIEGPILDILCGSQAGFVRGRTIEENIRYYNEKIVKAMNRGERYNLLLLDFAKAFDSVSRKYLLELLRRIGTPREFTYMIGGLYEDTGAKPILHGDHPVRIAMVDGLKQGCPLSPLLFILAIDPLLHQLSLLQDAEERCFADDLAVGFGHWETLMPVTMLVDYWSAAAGPRVNYGKTKLMTTVEDRPALPDILPTHWRMVTMADRYKYLGVLLSTDLRFVVAEVFAGALSKLRRRVNDLLRMKKRFNLGTRVEMANTYLVPIFSYLMRFYIMDDGTREAAEKLLQSWCIGRQTNMKRLAAPTHDAGLAHPLKDLRYINVAIMLRGGNTEGLRQAGHPLDMRHHRHRAAELFKAWTAQLPGEREQKELYKWMAWTDHEPVYKLRRTVQQRKYRHHFTETPSERTRTILRNTRRLPRKMAASLRNHQFLVIHGMLATRHSLRGDEAKKGCALCGNTGMDETMEHLFVDCPVTKAAISTLRGSPSAYDQMTAGVLEKAKIGHYTFTYSALKQKLMPIYVRFSKAVWRARWDCFGHTSSASPRLNQREVQAIIVDQFKRTRNLATAGGGKVRDREGEAAMFMEMLEALPEAHHAYTDGSAFKCKDSMGLVETPGPTGCGVYIRLEQGAEIYRSRSLDPGSNGMAEVQGMLLAAQAFLEQEPDDGLPLYMFTDNRVAISVATRAKMPWWCVDAATELRRCLKRIKERRKVIFCHEFM